MRLAQIGSGMTEADIVQVFVKEGDSVVEGQAIAEIEGSKVSEEVASMGAGTVLRVACTVGETLPVGSLLVVIGDPSEKEDAAGVS